PPGPRVAISGEDGRPASQGVEQRQYRERHRNLGESDTQGEGQKRSAGNQKSGSDIEVGGEREDQGGKQQAAAGLKAQREHAEGSQKKYGAEHAFDKSAAQCELQGNLPVMLYGGVVTQQICIYTFHAGMVVGIGEPGIEEGRERVADPEPVAQRPGSDDDKRGKDGAEEVAPAREMPVREADPGEGKG